MDDPKPRAKFVVRKREKKTRFSVRFADFLSTRLITIGGIGTIVAVSLVAVLLVAVVVPLFSSASLEVPHQVPAPWLDTQEPLYVKVDEYQTTGWALHQNGTLQIFRLDTGALVSSRQILSGGAKITSISVIPDFGNDISNDATRMQLAIGLEDGSVQLGTIGFQTSFREESDVRAGIRTLGIGEIAIVGEGVVQVTPQRQFRIQEVTSQFAPPIKLAETAITRLAHAPRLKNIAVAAYADEKLVFGVAKQRRSLDGETAYRLKPRRTLDYSWHKRGSPDYMLVPSRGDGIYIVWKDGHLARFDTRIIKEAQLAEELELLDDKESRITSIDFALNRETLLCGDSRGRIQGWFPVDRGNAASLKGAVTSTDGKLLAPIHQLPSGTAAVTSLGASERTRMIAAGYADGSLRVFHVTTDQLITDATTGRQQPIRYVAIAPKDDGLFAAVDRKLWRSEFDPGHPETTLTSLFLPIWYEGYDEPDMLWQSSFAGVGPEMKLGLWPLVFGTLKATFYCMLFGAPLALLAAVFTSEFMPPRMKGAIKPMVEMMASLPSVVLGFLAALVFAPVVEGFVPMTLCAFATLPLVFLLGAFLWLLLPQPIGLRYERYRFWLIGLVLVPLGLFFAGWLGPFVENWLFAGNIKLWLDGQIGTGTGAWMLVMLPTAGIVMTTVVSLAINPWMRSRCGQLSRRQFALLNLGKFLSALLLAFVLAWSCSELLTALGFDPRGSYVDTYVQRNALVVGFVMGFAVIPIIYTIAEDALSTVPQHLRSASLGAGATQWQTAVRIVIPTAMSGLFSAVMIGLGRAVGETMIVLMAGGNTPVREWNIFNGFRTLAANIAVELPEAVQNSTHYRTLFLAALTLFAMTFFVNTIAEFIRLRFRRRAIEL